MNLEQIKERLSHHFSNATIEVNGEGCNAEVIIVTPEFEGQRLLQRQKSVLTLFASEIKSGEIHALSIKAKTPQEIV